MEVYSGDVISTVRILLIGYQRILIGKKRMTSYGEYYFCSTMKMQKYIFVLLGLLLVLITPAVVSGNGVADGVSTEQTCGMHHANSSTDTVSSVNEAGDDELLCHVNHFLLCIHGVVRITGQQISNLVFQPCLIHWEPPKA